MKMECKVLCTSTYLLQEKDNESRYQFKVLSDEAKEDMWFADHPVFCSKKMGLYEMGKEYTLSVSLE